MSRVARGWLGLTFLGVILPVVLFACDDAARRAFDEAAEADRNHEDLEAATKYIKVHADAPDSRYGKLARARAKVILLEVGGQHLQAKQWEKLDTAAGKLLEVEPSSVAGHIYKSWAAYGQGNLDTAAALLEKAKGTPRGVAPPTKEALEATAEALFDGAEAGAKSALSIAVVDEQFLKNARARLNNKITRERQSNARRAELLAKNTLEAMATLLDNYPDSPEAAKVREPYAVKIAAKLQSIETVGPPRVEDPDPISTIVDALSSRAPEEEVSKQAVSKVKALRAEWEEHYEEQLEDIDTRVAKHHVRSMDAIATHIREKCAPLRVRLEKGDDSARPLLAKARQKAEQMVPNGLTPADLQEVAGYILVNCSPSKQKQGED